LTIEASVVVWPRVQTNLRMSIGALQMELKWEEKYGTDDSEHDGSVMHYKTSPREETAAEKSTPTLLACRKSSRCGDRSSGDLVRRTLQQRNGTCRIHLTTLSGWQSV
jgi:hypothetical protein